MPGETMLAIPWDRGSHLACVHPQGTVGDVCGRRELVSVEG